MSISNLLVPNNLTLYCNNIVTSATANNVVLPTAANTTLTAAQSGSVFYLPQATANNVISLPAPAAGLNFQFILSNVADGTHKQTISSTAANVYGNLISLSTGTTNLTLINSGTAFTSIDVSATAANTKKGDFIRYRSDGTSYFVEAISVGTLSAWTNPT